jgi:hypothetical protein
MYGYYSISLHGAQASDTRMPWNVATKRRPGTQGVST